MTLNEMLFGAGLIKEFDNAIERKDKIGLIQILKKVNIPDERQLFFLLDDNYFSL